MPVVQLNMIDSNNDRNWIAPPKVIIRKGKQGEPEKLSYWVDKKGKNHLYTEEELITCNILINLNLILIRSLIILDTLKSMDRNAQVKKLVNQDYSKYKASKSSVFNRFINLMAAVPNITFGEFLGFISDSKDPQALIKIGQDTLKKSSRKKDIPFDIFYNSDLIKKS